MLQDNSKHRTHNNPNGHRTFLLLVLCLFGLCVFSMVTTPKRAKRTTAKKTAKTDDRVYLVHSDELKYDQYSMREAPQIVKGKAHFIHKGAHLWCDSAYFFQESNAVQAFGHVKFKQGDTLSLTCDYADYDGSVQMMHARHNVVLKHRTQTLYTDSLDYDRLYNNAYFFEGGRLIDGKDRLISDWGEYSTATRKAAFYYNVRMINDRQTIKTDTLFYDTQTSVSHVTGPSTITSQGSTIQTEDAYLNSRTDQSSMFSRSTLMDKGKTITGDSLFHNSKTGENEGFGNVVYVDTVNKNSLIGDYVFYNETTGYGIATKNAVVQDYSQKDTLYMHADTLKLFTYNINTDSIYRVVHGFPHARAYRTDMQAVSDSLVFSSLDSCLTMYHDPITWNENRQLLGEVIKIYMNDSTIRKAEIIDQALSVEQADQKNHYNQLSSKRMDIYFTDGVLRQTTATGNVKAIYYSSDDNDSTLSEHNYIETDTIRMYFSEQRKMQKIWASKSVCRTLPMTQIPPDKLRLPEFAWFEDIRPRDKNDIFEWRGKSGDSKLKALPRQEAPLQHLSKPVVQPSEKPAEQAAEPETTKPETAAEPQTAEPQATEPQP